MIGIRPMAVLERANDAGGAMHPSVLRRCTLVGLRKLTARERLAPPHPERPVPIGALRRCWERNLSTTMGHSTGLIREQCPVW